MQVGAYAVSKQFAEQNPEAVESWRRAVAATARLPDGPPGRVP